MRHEWVTLSWGGCLARDAELSGLGFVWFLSKHVKEGKMAKLDRTGALGINLRSQLVRG